ncbi:MAG: phosphoenolpyruvate synthase, partial [Gammaproteobacteria bacterium]|nr:phosphoenolpyruvate synthase [Gammaproteobacteria bacterium]
PETVHSSQVAHVLKTYTLEHKGEILASGRSVGRQIGAGKARIILEAAHMNQLEPGDVLITDITDPDWEPVMRKASAIVTNRGGRVCHAAIIARELGIPAIVGTNDATTAIQDGAPVTVSCAEGDVGNIYAGELPFTVDEQVAEQATPARTDIMLNIGNPGNAFELSALPSAGVGLARIEFIIANSIGIHPRALLEYDSLDADTRAAIDVRIAGFDSPTDFYRDYLAEGIATIAAAFYPRPVYVRLGDFKSNEYAALLGGSAFEPHEENPMLGLRGAVRYYAPGFEDSFALECAAIHKARSDMGLNNINLLIPFVRTTMELGKILELLAAHGLARGQDDLRVNVMCELPANVIRADAFLELCDGFSIGSNDLTQLVLGVDRDSSLPGNFDERDPAVLEMISMAIAACRRSGKHSGICGQAPSDFPELAAWLVEQGIDSISVNRDALITVTRNVIAAEKKSTSPAGIQAN